MLRPRRFSSACPRWRRRNGANDGSINRQVANGRGGTKECQTTGTTTDAGYPEHTFNWDVVLRVREELSRLGVRTAMSRGNDNAFGPCVDQRAAMANALRPWRAKYASAVVQGINAYLLQR
ncbi:MAG: N-acetylmuramoyl-L-alanine amidase [Mycobacterium sp.]|jgi:N-acetylmuramoyl-L-alanine amidase|nr:N-acetylmuramoyl-L-alanine amidase [Mycobacterium sp.]